MRTTTRTVIALGVLALASGCSTMSKLNPFAKEEKFAPAKLEELKPGVPARIVWKHSTGKAGANVFTPALADNSVFVADTDGNIERLDAASGKVQWRSKAGTDLSAGVGVSPDAKLVAVGTAKGELLAFDGSGKALWKIQASSEILSAPAVGPDVVIVRTVDNKVTAYDAADGKKRWFIQRGVPPLTLRNMPGLVIANSNVYAAQPAGRILAMALSNGVPRFEVPLSEPRGATELERVSDISGTPSVFDQDLCAVSYQGKVGCLDLNTGVARWTKPASSDVGLGVDQRFVFVSDEKGAVQAFNRENGASVWKNEKLAYRRLSAPVSYGRFVAVGDLEGYVHFLSREDGTMLGRIATDGSAIKSAPLLSGPNVIFQTQNGTVAAIAVE
ncbi:outer membrane protein assembly factor BamB [Pseudoduganella eburnea]|uniref:Outer membrane protein assembly factor BamB n=1 Tax=Massilia eburnea TaxID=1776165 RepID=A0A6L6QMG5_9BURK|nr:outer membrane protein assembly factor BamB [Massilia eburnea]MTW13097.1 outer membrane protein assembly factor BamB [Massilia eburnea]